MDQDILNDFLKGYDDHYYPEDFQKKYELMECLAQNALGETLLVRDRYDTDYIAKCYTNASLLSQVSESELLKRLHHSGLPKLVEEFKNEKMLCVVRQYAQGIPLSQLKEPLTEAQIINVGIQLCDILTYLHGQKPPVIHRDIKPQNIIIDESGKVTLIDFGISREYDESARADTVFFGTQEFAPPEQYGFSQTDNRADIFSLGVVLAWLLTGSTSLKTFRIKHRRLEHIVRKCTAFSPLDRYRDAERVKRALQNADGHKEKKILRMFGTVLVLFAVLTAGFAVGRFTDVQLPVFYNNSYAYFSEPLVERAARVQLGKAEGEPISIKELDNITELYIYYDKTVKTWDEFNTLRNSINSGKVEANYGDISSLDDIVKLRNLKRLSIGYQDIKDISALKNLGGLTVLEIFGCPIDNIEAVRNLEYLKHFSLSECDYVTDISPIASCENLNELIISASFTKDFSALASMDNFEYIHMLNIKPGNYLTFLQGKSVYSFKIGHTKLDSFSELAGIKDMNNLTLDNVQVSSLEGIENLSGITELSIINMPYIDLTPLTLLTNLKTLTVSSDMKDAAEAIADKANFEIVYK